MAYGGTAKAGVFPRKMRAITLAVTEATTTAEKFLTVNSPRMISKAKRTPATGALNVAAIPPPAPQATNMRTRSSDIRSACPMVDPRAEPIWTIGPSRPADPPVPMQMDEANALITTTTGRIRPPRRATASMTSGTPCPLASRAK